MFSRIAIVQHLFFSRYCRNTMLAEYPSFGCVTITSVSTEVECVQEAWEQGRLFCKVGFCASALCALQMCLTWCVGYLGPIKRSPLKCIMCSGKSTTQTSVSQAMFVECFLNSAKSGNADT